MAARRLAKIIDCIWPRMGLRRYGRYLVRRLGRLRATPHAIGAGVAAGAAVSMLPLIGLHFVLAFVLAYLTRGSMIAAAIGTAWGNPITFPIFFGAAYQLGDLLTGHSELLDAAVLEQLGETMERQSLLAGIDSLWPVFRTMMIGGLPLAAVVWVGFYVGTRSAVDRLRRARRQSPAVG